MTRNFEEEYRKYAGSNVPDLWSRIEAAIDEADRNALNNNDSVIVKESSNVTNINKVTDINRRKIRRINPAYVTLIAACACLLLAIGVVRFIGGAKASAPMMSESATAPAPAAAEEAAPAAAEEYEESDDMAAYEATDNMAVYEAEEATADAEAYVEEAAAEAGEYDEAAYADEAPAMDSAKQSFKADLEATASGATNGAAMKAEIILVGTIDDITEVKNGRIAEVTVSDPLETGFTKGEIISVLVTDEIYDSLSDVLEDSVSNKYTITLDEEDANTYVLKAVEIKK